MHRRDFFLSSAFALAAARGARGAADPAITVVYQAMGGVCWPVFVAKEGGYYQKYGLDVHPTYVAYPGAITMLVHDQAAMAISGLQQILPAEVNDHSLVAVGCWMNRSTFALISRSDIASVRDLKHKRIAVGQIGDSPYGYLLSVLAKFGLSAADVEMIPVGSEASGRAAALSAGRVDATLLTAPASFRMEDAGYRSLANLVDYDDVFTSAAYWIKKTDLGSGSLVERLIKAHAEAIHRFYTDKSFAVQAYLAYDKQSAADMGRSYDIFAKSNIFERVPYILTGAVAATLNQQTGPGQLKIDSFRGAVDNSVIDRLVKQGFFVNLFGPAIKTEQEKKASLAFR
jgi:ABC-type nitrate/sulfonate/bicarbonate transport system substrate-binding protein